MDISTILGILAGAFLIIYSIAQGGGLIAFLDLDAALIVIGGTLTATLTNFQLKEVLGVLGVVKNAFFDKLKPREEIVTTIVKFADTARREGLLAMENNLSSVDDKYLKKGLQLIIDGASEDLVKKIMETELDNVEERHKVGIDIFIAMAGYAPAFGMIGTLIGLIQMLRSLEDPTQIGAGMAIALITTFYGSFVANILFLPLSGKLKRRSKTEIEIKELILSGIIGIMSGENPRMVRDTLITYVQPKQRAQIEAA